MKANYPIKGTFIDEITYDIPSSNWTRKQWSKDFDYMKAVGINTLIFIRGGFYNRALFPSKNFPHLKDADDDFAGFVFKEAQKRKMNVYMGLYISDLTWGNGDAQTEIEKNKLFIDEVVERYSNFKSFKGWYIPHEVGNDTYNICDIFLGLGKMCKEKTPNKPILISPFFYSKAIVKKGALNPKQSAEEWDNIFTKAGKYIDYCAFQDGSAPFNQMEEYFAEMQKTCEKHGIELWANVEGFVRDKLNSFYPVDMDLLKTKINMVKPYVKNYITFEFSHSMSPQANFNSARNLYYVYKEYYKKKPF